MNRAQQNAYEQAEGRGDERAMKRLYEQIEDHHDSRGVIDAVVIEAQDLREAWRNR
jgi:hypothetical protein